jgi:hypothetical protein
MPSPFVPFLSPASPREPHQPIAHLSVVNLWHSTSAATTTTKTVAFAPERTHHIVTAQHESSRGSKKERNGSCCQISNSWGSDIFVRVEGKNTGSPNGTVKAKAGRPMHNAQFLHHEVVANESFSTRGSNRKTAEHTVVMINRQICEKLIRSATLPADYGIMNKPVTRPARLNRAFAAVWDAHHRFD